jgi:hypothetical protein
MISTSLQTKKIQRYPFLGFVSECQVVLIEPINHVKEGAIISCISLFNSLLKISVLDRSFAKIVVPGNPCK